ncbi:hypothetical protein A2886_00965 [candidate division WWE3 bacterium RIFCSPHIGHO2_01_FULL_42_13]|uniref:Polysaccharide biosynthesis protein C-terminal domain-containing protein n=1 Tax=candidate division WWE3 bacterium RIFCSPHIGHO2_01_FULL_42_13 TaxID=1802617 RepID=A0A1F4UQE1_UNCKA|nr:MAG: hypothetical protein A2886_00965 [candidate division WWE3 bacterium RIFCSPHIGHO2_01_FULL_42_13]
MITRARNLIKNPAFSRVVIVTAGSFIGSVFAYLLQIFLGRWLSVSDFGTFTALLSVYVILGVLATSFTTSLIKLVSNLSTQNKYGTLTRIFLELSTVVLGVGSLLFTLIFLFRQQLASFLSISDPNLLIYFGAFLGLSFLVILPIAYLQGLLKFKAYAAFSVSTQFLRLIIPVLIVMAGFKLAGAFVGMGLSFAGSYLIGTWMLSKHFLKSDDVSLKHYYKNVLAFAGSVLFVQIGLTLLNNIDIVLVKHFFDETSAGLYAGLVTTGKVLLFGASTVGVVMFPTISSAYGNGEDVLEKFRPLLILQIMVVIVGVVVFTLMPNFITRVMFGASYLASAELLPRFSIFVGMYVLINFMILFFLAVEKTKVVLLLLPAITLQVILISLHHESLVSVVNVNLAISFALLLGVGIYFIKSIKS